MNKNALIVASVTLLTVSCLNRQSSGRDLAKLGFYSTPERIIKVLNSDNPAYAEHYMLGLAFKRKKQYSDAIYHFANSAFVYQRNKTIRPFPGPVHQFLDEFHIKSDYYDDALHEIADLFYKFREYAYVVKFVDMMEREPTVLYRDAAILKSRALVELKQFDKAIEFLTKTIPLYDHKSSQALLRIRFASTLGQLPNDEKAVEEYFRVIELAPESWHAGIAAGQILVFLKNRNQPLTADRKLLLGKAMYHTKKYTGASELIIEALGASDLTSDKVQAAEYLVKSHVRERKYDSAARLVSDMKGKDEYETLALCEADELWDSRNFSMAIQRYQLLAESSKDTARHALMRITLHAEERKIPGYQELLARFIERFPEDPYSDRFSWLLARSHIRACSPQNARPIMERAIALNPDGKYSDHMRFWLYKILSAEGKSNEALSIMEDMAVKNPDSSYFWILLDETAKKENPSDIARDLDKCNTDACRVLRHSLLTIREKSMGKRDERLRKYNYGDIRGFANLESKIDGLVLRSDSAGRLRSLKKYFAVGEISAVHREISSLPDNEETKADVHTALAHYAGKYRHYHLAALSTIQLMNILKLDNNFMLMKTATLGRLYPGAFQGCVKKYAGQYNVSVPVLYAVIRAESLYNHEAVSSAGAVGLMQFMPSTARAIATELKLGNFNLKLPCTSVRFGAHHLNWLNRAYGGKIELMMAAYNAGPGNVRKWQEQFRTDDIHLFTEMVPFDETRYYMLRTKKHLLQEEIILGP